MCFTSFTVVLILTFIIIFTIFFNKNTYLKNFTILQNVCKNKLVAKTIKYTTTWNAAFNRLLRNLCDNLFAYIKTKFSMAENTLTFLKTSFFTTLKVSIFNPFLNVGSTTSLSAPLAFFFKKFTFSIYKAIELSSFFILIKYFFNHLNNWFLVINQFMAGNQSSILQIRNNNFFLSTKNIATYRIFAAIPTQITLGLFNIYKNIRTVALPLVLSILFFFVLLDFFSVDFLRQCGVWAVFGFLAFWLFSSFNFFIKRYKYGKFTSAIQRFWKRTNAYFWIIEGFMFSLFFYYFLNSSQEPLYMYDESNLNQQFLPGLVASYQSYLLLLFIFFYTLYLLLALPTFKSTQQILHLGLMTLAYTYIYLLESYQVYYLLTSFYENFWVYDAEAALWSLEIEIPRVRVKQQYFYIALVLKFWHFIFIYLSWLFVVMKAFERKTATYALLGLSSQNILILFALNILFNAQWLTWFAKRFYETAYYWFFTAPNEFTLLNFFQELIIICQFYA